MEDNIREVKPGPRRQSGAIVVRLRVIAYKDSIKNLAGIHATISWLPDFSFLSFKTFINLFAKGKTRATKS